MARVAEFTIADAYHAKLGPSNPRNAVLIKTIWVSGQDLIMPTFSPFSKHYGLRCYTPRGELRWSLTWEGVARDVCMDGDRFYLMPERLAKGGTGFIELVVLDSNGREAGKFPVSAKSEDRFAWLTVKGGVVVARRGTDEDLGEYDARPEEVLWTLPGPHTDPEAVATARDLEIARISPAPPWQTSATDYYQRWRAGEITLVPAKYWDRTKRGTPAMQRRVARTKDWNGRRLKISTLPLYEPIVPRNPVLSDRELSIGVVIRLESDGGVWVNGALGNVHGYSEQEYAKHRGEMEDRDRPFVARFDRHGDLLSFLVMPADVTRLAVGTDVIYVQRGEGLFESWSAGK